VKRKSIPPVVTIDNYNNTVSRFANGKVSRVSKIKRGKNDTVISYIANKDLIIELIELSANLPQEHIKDIITDKAYEELRLDTAVEYEVYPIKTAIKSDMVKYQAIIADVNNIKSSFADLAKKVKYIDYLIPAPLLYKVLYQDRLLDDSSTDMFIYFGDYDTFITFYHKGEFLYSKSINFSLNNIYDRFCQLAQEVPLTKEQFREMLSNNGLKADSKEHRELLIRVFNECFLTINDIIIYLKRSYEINKIKKAFVGFSWGYTDGIEVFFKNYLNMTSKPIVSIYSKDDPKSALDPVHSLMRLTAIDLDQERLDLPNLTPYPKPKPFLQRPAGKIIMTFIGISLLGLAPSAYEYIIGLSYNGKNLILEQKERRLTREANKYRAILKKKDEEIKSLDKAIDTITKEYNRRRGEITKVYDKKFKYALKSEQLALLTDILKKYEIVSSNIRVDGDEYFVDVEAKNDKKITTFVKSVVKNFNKEIESINIEEIAYDKKDKLYKGVLKVKFKKGQK
jgi:hypothetical protein